MKNNKTKKIVFTAVFAALCCIATYLIIIPIPLGIGYVNFGDVFVLAAAWCLGGYGALAGIGCALADILIALENGGVNVEYMYSFAGTDNHAQIAFKTGTPEKAIAARKAVGATVL